MSSGRGLAPEPLSKRPLRVFLFRDRIWSLFKRWVRLFSLGFRLAVSL
jgi:hypothetical protein